MTDDTAALNLLFQTAVTWVLGGLALTMLFTYWAGRRWRLPRAPLVLRILAVLGLVLPGWRILAWYRQLRRVREWADDLPLTRDVVAETFLTNSVALLTLGFLVMVAGIYLARRVPASIQTGGAERR